MREDLTAPSRRLLDPMERISEILFALIMVLTVTCSFSVAGGGREEVRTMLVGALGCNLAWGIIDAVFYLMDCFGSQARGVLQLRAVRSFTDPGKAHRVIAHTLPPLLASVLSPADFEMMRQKLNQLPPPAAHLRLAANDWLGAVGVFLIVFLSTLPVVGPFVFISEPKVALRVSNAIAIAMLFLVGWRFGLYAGHRPWRMGISMVLLSAAMVGVAIALGG